MELHFPAWLIRIPDYQGCGLVRYAFGIRSVLNTGGERGIRTPDTRKGIHAFEARAFSHSAISPRRKFHFILSGKPLARILQAHSHWTEPGSLSSPKPRMRFVTWFTILATSGSVICV
jgi:hypothetical protein